MDKFDQWYNKKMDEQDVAYSESSWDSFSQQLNQLPGSRKRRRPFMFIWILALTLIVGAGSIFAWQAFNNPGINREILISTEEEDSNAIPAIKSESDEAVKENNNRQPLAANILPESSDNNYSGQSSNSSMNGRNSEDLNSSAKQIKRKPASQKALAFQKGDSDLISKEARNENLDSDGKDLKGNASDQIGMTEASFVERPSTVTEIKANVVSSEASDVQSVSSSDRSTETFENASLASVQTAGRDALAPLNIEIKSLEQESMDLPKFALLMNEINSLSPPIVECCPYKGWSHNVELGAQFFPGINEGSRFFTGLQGAYHLQYRWALRWSASAGAGVLQRWGSFGGFQDSPQDIYTTTKVRRGFLLVPSSATYLQIPAMVNFHAGKHIISAGVRTLFLLGIKGQLDQYQLQRSGNEADFSFNSNTVNRGWINESGFRSIVPEYMLSYGYQLNKHWSVSVSGAWMPNGIAFAEKTAGNLDILDSLTAATDSGGGQQPFLLEDKWQVGMALRFKF